MAVNSKMIEAGLGMLARFIPPEEYAKAVKAINDLAAIAQRFDDRLAHVQGLAELVKVQQDRIDFLETVVRNNVDGGAAAFAERDSWGVGDRVTRALAPAVTGALNDDH